MRTRLFCSVNTNQGGKTLVLNSALPKSLPRRSKKARKESAPKARVSNVGPVPTYTIKRITDKLGSQATFATAKFGRESRGFTSLVQGGRVILYKESYTGYRAATVPTTN